MHLMQLFASNQKSTHHLLNVGYQAKILACLLAARTLPRIDKEKIWLYRNFLGQYQILEINQTLAKFLEKIPKFWYSWLGSITKQAQYLACAAPHLFGFASVPTAPRHIFRPCQVRVCPCAMSYIDRHTDGLEHLRADSRPKKKFWQTFGCWCTFSLGDSLRVIF